MAARKPRSDSKVAALPEPMRQEIARRLGEENQSYAEVAKWLAEDGHKVSASALCNWYSVHSWEVSRDTALDFAERVRADQACQADFDEATLGLVRERAYILARTKGADVKDLATLAGIIGESAKLRLKQRELELNLEKFRQQTKADIEKGLDALHAEIKGNAEALALFAKFKDAVLRSTEGKG